MKLSSMGIINNEMDPQIKDELASTLARLSVNSKLKYEGELLA
jgi:hypothetical protein